MLQPRGPDLRLPAARRVITSMRHRHPGMLMTASAARRSPAMGTGTSTATAHAAERRSRNRWRAASCGASSGRRAAGKRRNHGFSPTAAACRVRSVTLTPATTPFSTRLTYEADLPIRRPISHCVAPAVMRATRSSRPRSRRIHEARRAASRNGETRLDMGRSCRSPLTVRLSARTGGSSLVVHVLSVGAAPRIHFGRAAPRFAASARIYDPGRQIVLPPHTTTLLRSSGTDGCRGSTNRQDGPAWFAVMCSGRTNRPWPPTA